MDDEHMEAERKIPSVLIIHLSSRSSKPKHLSLSTVSGFAGSAPRNTAGSRCREIKDLVICPLEAPSLGSSSGWGWHKEKVTDITTAS